MYPERVSCYDMLLEMVSVLLKACIYIVFFQILISLIKKIELYGMMLSELGVGFSALLCVLVLLFLPVIGSTTPEVAS